MQANLSELRNDDTEYAVWQHSNGSHKTTDLEHGWSPEVLCRLLHSKGMPYLSMHWFAFVRLCTA